MTNSNDHLEQIQALAESNTRNIDILVGIVAGHQQHIATVLDEIRDIKVEIKDMQTTILGLQTENRRILDRLFTEDGNSHQS